MPKPGVRPTSLGANFQRGVEASAPRSFGSGEDSREEALRTRLGAAASGILFVAAMGASLFFNGFRGEWFGIALALFTLWLLSIFWRAHGLELRLPAGVLAILLGLYWLWFGITLLWHPVPQMGTAYFWILGTLPLAFFGNLIEPDGAAHWRVIASGALALAVLLAAWSLWQFFVLRTWPRSAFLDANSHAGFLNLVTLPAAGIWLAGGSRERESRGILLTAIPSVVLFLLLFAVFLSKGRAAGLSLGLGLALLLSLGARRAPRRSVVLAVLAAVAFTAANTAWHGEVAQRIQQTLFTPAEAGVNRFLIWRQAWSMLGENPWTGIGIGTFWLRWPIWRAPEDMSAGFFVHNDYLQLWLEAGIVAPLLLAAALATALVGAAKALPAASFSRRMELGGLAGGVLALALHGFFNFNLYQLPVLMLAGALLARLESLTRDAAGIRALSFAGAMSRWGFRGLSSALALLMFAYAGSQAAYAYLYRRGVVESREGHYAAADTTFLAAARMAPMADNVLMTHADLMRRLAGGLPDADAEKREFLYRSAIEMLTRARALNPYRAENALILGQLVQDNPTLYGPGWRDEALSRYREALGLDPRQYAARTAMAELLLAQGESDAGRRVVEEGLRYWYPATTKLVPYYELVRRLRLEAGEMSGVQEMDERLRAIREADVRLDPFLLDPPPAAGGTGAAPAGVGSTESR
jgi:O-antigen ligase